MRVAVLRFGSLVVLGSLLSAAPARAEKDHEWGLKPGQVQLQSVGPMVFGPDNILFIGDTTGAAVYALDTADADGDPAKFNVKLPDVAGKLAAELGAAGQTVQIKDLAVNPNTGNVFLSATVGESNRPAIVRITAAGKINPLKLDNVLHQKAVLANAPDSAAGRRGNPRDDSITDLTYIDGKLLVAGLAKGESASMVRELPFPFADASTGTNVEIYHAAHGRFEDNGPVRTFVPFTVDGEPMLLAGFTCTPLVKLPLNSLKPGQKVRGTTVAELGNRNRPLDMLVYKKGGKSYVLMSNSARGVMKISTDNLQENAGLTTPVRGGGTAGQQFETIKELTGIEQMDRLTDDRGVVLAKTDDGTLELRTIDLP